MHPPVDEERPQTRADCADADRPCPWVGCRHHLYLDVNPQTGSIKINFPDLEPWEIPETCALDIADQGGAILQDVGDVLNLTRERVRQIEGGALRKLRAASPGEKVLAPVLQGRRRRGPGKGSPLHVERGDRFGSRVVLGEAARLGDGRRRMSVQCDCGSVQDVQLASLLRTESCTLCRWRRVR